MSESIDENEVDVLPIVRDVTFARHVVDKAVVVDLGRDIELACIQAGPLVEALQSFEEHEKIEMTPAYSEVARIRMAWPSAVGMAMHILERGISANKLRGDAIIKSLTDLTAQAEEADDGDADQ